MHGLRKFIICKVNSLIKMTIENNVYFYILCGEYLCS